MRIKTALYGANEMSEKQCKLCEKPTQFTYNINFKAVPVCEECALAITKQEVITWVSRKEKDSEE